VAHGDRQQMRDQPDLRRMLVQHLAARLEAARTSETEREAVRRELRASPAVAATLAYRNLDLALAKGALNRAGVPDPGRLAGFVEAVAGRA
jgi:hypothetical protein